jgi:cation:H+ antiporter
VAIVAAIPGMLMVAAGFHAADVPLLGLLIFGGAIVAAAFVLTWGAELAQVDIGSGLAVVFIALVTVLPEYAVDMMLAWKGGTDDTYQKYALANMTGANRLLIGLGWPTVAFLVWYRTGRREVVLGSERAADVVWLALATLYSAVIPLKGTLAWYDAAILITCYVLYVRSARNEPDDSHPLVGPPRVMAAWPRPRRRKASLILFLWSAFAICVCVHPFVESLIATGKALEVNETFMLQWLAPLASESPEFVVVVLLTLRGCEGMGFGAFVSSKVNQWTLLVGGVPLAFGLSHHVHHDSWVAMGLTSWQVEELWLTITQGLYATAAIADLSLSLRQATVILVLFLIQFVGSVVLEAEGHHEALSNFHIALSILYTLLALERLVAQRAEVRKRFRDVFGRAREP